VNCNKNLPGYISFEDNENNKQQNVVSNNELINFLNSRDTKDAKNLLVNDYYTYTCKPSIERLIINDIPNYINIINNDTLLQDKIYNQCIELVEINKNKHNNLNAFYESARKHISIDAAKNYLNKEIALIDELRLDTINNNLWKFLAHFNKSSILGTFVPLYFQILPDEKKNTKYTVYLTNVWIHQYKALKLENLDNRREYTKYVGTVFSKLLGKNNNVIIEDIIEVNNDIYECVSKSNTRFDYTIVYRNNEQKYNFNYEEFFKELGYQYEDIPPSIVIKDIVYFEKICKLLLDNWNSDKWRSYWLMSYTRQLARFTDELSVYQFNYFTKYNKGPDYEIPTDINAIKLTCMIFNKLISELYIEKYIDKNGIDYLTTMVNDLKMEFYRIIQNNKWMSPNAKKTALLNVESLKIIIGRNISSIDDFEITYTGDIWQNVMLYMEKRHLYFLTIYGTNIRNIPNISWNKFPFEFEGQNIFKSSIEYDATYNLIYIPSGYIQQPIMDLRSKGLLYNISNIGFKIAKEFNKVIDDVGSHYNSYGMLENWWNNSDKAKYKSLKQNIINEYILLVKKDKQQYNITGLETDIIAFVNGFYICYSYLQSYYYSIKLPYIITDSKLSTFYSYFANSYKEKIKNVPKVTLNPRVSYKHLINLTLSKNVMFNDKFDIKKGDNMYIQNKEIIW
jgi:predicted metalloendopeptidase